MYADHEHGMPDLGLILLLNGAEIARSFTVLQHDLGILVRQTLVALILMSFNRGCEAIVLQHTPFSWLQDALKSPCAQHVPMQMCCKCN